MLLSKTMKSATGDTEKALTTGESGQSRSVMFVRVTVCVSLFSIVVKTGKSIEGQFLFGGSETVMVIKSLTADLFSSVFEAFK